MNIQKLKIYPPCDAMDIFNFYDDVAEYFWPEQLDKDNHLAQEEIQKFAVEKLGEQPQQAGYGTLTTPHGIVTFDSESGGIGAYSTNQEALQYMIDELIIPIIQSKQSARIEAGYE